MRSPRAFRRVDTDRPGGDGRGERRRRDAGGPTGAVWRHLREGTRNDGKWRRSLGEARAKVEYFDPASTCPPTLRPADRCRYGTGFRATTTRRAHPRASGPRGRHPLGVNGDSGERAARSSMPTSPSRSPPSSRPAAGRRCRARRRSCSSTSRRRQTRRAVVVEDDDVAQRLRRVLSSHQVASAVAVVAGSPHGGCGRPSSMGRRMPERAWSDSPSRGRRSKSGMRPAVPLEAVAGARLGGLADAVLEILGRCKARRRSRPCRSQDPAEIADSSPRHPCGRRDADALAARRRRRARSVIAGDGSVHRPVVLTP